MKTEFYNQFYEFKSQHPDALLLFRCGDFYETYCDDAQEAARILGIALTRSDDKKEADGTRLRMSMFPHHALDCYLPKLIRAGKRVAICDRLEDPKLTKKLMKRGITELNNQK
jgi:DNA mismatch repair protein MutS